MPFPSTSTSSQHSYSQSVPSFAASVPNPSASRQSTLLDPRASVIARHRTSSSPSGLGIPAGALHMAKLANGNIKTFAAKAKRHLNDLSSNSATQDRAASPLARFSKKFPTHRNRSTSQPLSGLDTKAAAASGGSPSRLTTPTSPNSTIFGIKVPRDQFSKVFGVPLQEAAKGTRLLSPDRLDTDKMVLSATRSSQDFDDRARYVMPFLLLSYIDLK